MIVIWDNGSPGYDGHDVAFVEAGENTVDEIVALLKIADRDGRVIATAPSITWTTGKVGGEDPAEYVAENCYLFIDDAEDRALAKKNIDLGAVPQALLARLVKAMRVAKKDPDRVKFFANALARRRRVAARAKPGVK